MAMPPEGAEPLNGAKPGPFAVPAGGSLLMRGRIGWPPPTPQGNSEPRQLNQKPVAGKCGARFSTKPHKNPRSAVFE